MTAFGLLFAPLDLLIGVLLREPGQHAPLASLRYGQLCLSSGERGQVLPRRVRVLDLVREQNGLRRGAALGVILLDEGGQHLGRVAPGQVEQGVFLALQRAAAVMQHAHARPGLSLHERDRVQLGERPGDHMLPRAELLDGAQAVAKVGRSLELQFLRRLVHLLSQLALELLRAALEDGRRL